jgi:hypothetical protein
MPDCDTGVGLVHPRPPLRTRLRFLDFDASESFPLNHLVAEEQDEALRIEALMATIARVSQNRRLRVATLRPGNWKRCVYVGSEPGPDRRLLASSIAALDGRSCAPEDFIFAMERGALGRRPEDTDILRAAIHNVAMLTAAGESTTSCAAVYLCSCIVMVSAMGADPRGRELASDFLRMWLRAELAEGDPPAWDHGSVARLALLDPWAAAFMEGLGEATRTASPILFPASLSAISLAAGHLRAMATLGRCTPMGNA